MQQSDQIYSKNLPPSPVLLVCITNKQNHIITHDIYFKHFSKYGEVQRILIFERSLLWKTFVEMDNCENANIAKDSLNNTYIFDDNTRMNVYNSQLQKIIFQENNSGGVDYTILKKKIEEKKQFKKVLANSSQTFNYDPEYDLTNQIALENSIPEPYAFKGQQQQQQLLNETPKIIYQYNNSQGVHNSGCSDGTITNARTAYNYSEHTPFGQGCTPSDKNSRKISLFSQINNSSLGISKTQSDQLPYPSNYKLIEKEKAVQSLNINQAEQTTQQQTKNYFTEQFFINNQKYFDSQKKNQQSLSKTLSSITSGTIAYKEDQKSSAQIKKMEYDFDIEKLNVIDSEYNLDKQQNQQENQDQIEEEEFKANNTGSDNSLEENAFKSAFSNQFTTNINDIKNTTIAQNMNHYDFKLNNITLSQLNSVEDKKTAVIDLIENETKQNIEKKTDQSIQKIDKLIDEKKQKQQKKLMTISLDSKPFNFTEQINQDQSQQNNEKQKQPISQSADLYENITEDLDLANYVNPLFLKATRKSKVIYARWFEKEKVNLNMLYNIFSTFGNIEKMIYMKEKSSVLVEYQKIENAQIAKEYLNDQNFLGQQVKIFYSNYEKVFIKDPKVEKIQVANNIEEYFIGYPSTYRFQNDKQFQINPISDTLHISNLKREACYIDILTKFFPKIMNNLQNYKFIMHQNNKNMCLLKFETKEQALEALAYMHNTEIYGRKIQISFSKIKLQANMDQDADYFIEQSFA